MKFDLTLIRKISIQCINEIFIKKKYKIKMLPLD